MTQREIAQALIDSRKDLAYGPLNLNRYDIDIEEGGCGVTGFACNIPVNGRHIIEPSIQMHNRGNGKGGGIAAVGLTPEKLGVNREILENDFLLQIALLDCSVLSEMEARFIRPFFIVDHEAFVETVDDYRDIPDLEIKPPDVKRYFVRVKPEVLERFAKERGLHKLPIDKVEEEFIYQNSYSLNLNLYSALGEKKAFVLSHGKNMMILKIVGYAEMAAMYYKLESFDAHIWIAHQRYPTKGKVWHPGGAHPFIGLNEALVHNGDFANYHSVTEYLRQRHVYPLFLTDTEVSVLVFDLLNRVYGYPLEYIIEALAPTGEMDFDHLPDEKKFIYRQIQATHIHGSPDGPWFFIIARNDVRKGEFQLIGITDTSMLRPQVFALQKGDVEIGLICSEKQAIDATLESLSKEDPRFGKVADLYWNARGGSYSDGGAFVFTVKKGEAGNYVLECTDKFGRTKNIPQKDKPFDFSNKPSLLKKERVAALDNTVHTFEEKSPRELFDGIKPHIQKWGYNEFFTFIDTVKSLAEKDGLKEKAIELLTLLLDLRYHTGTMRRRSLLQMLNETLDAIFQRFPSIEDETSSGYGRLINYETRKSLRPPIGEERVLFADASLFPPEGDESFARLISDAYFLGWRRFVCFKHRGQRFLGCGFGPDTKDVRIDAYGSTGDYLASGIDGMEIYVHGNGQDQLGQILKAGKLVVYGDVGQTFMYGAKGGDVFVMGNAAGRPLINGVGKPRVVINGTALDFLAESFMAGDPHNNGGFVVLNGLTFDGQGNIVFYDTPYQGSNLFSLASGGAIFIRDPHKKIVPEQLNGGQIIPFEEKDWQLILPYLKENERLFGISIDDLLTVDGIKREPSEVYRTIGAVRLSMLASTSLMANEEWEEL